MVECQLTETRQEANLIRSSAEWRAGAGASAGTMTLPPSQTGSRPRDQPLGSDLFNNGLICSQL